MILTYVIMTIQHHVSEDGGKDSAALPYVVHGALCRHDKYTLKSLIQLKSDYCSNTWPFFKFLNQIYLFLHIGCDNDLYGIIFWTEPMIKQNLNQHHVQAWII